MVAYIEEALAEKVHGETRFKEEEDLWSKPLQEISERIAVVEKSLQAVRSSSEALER